MKFIQIAATGVDNNQSTQCNVYVFGLTKDGSVYVSTDGDHFNHWQKIQEGKP